MKLAFPAQPVPTVTVAGTDQSVAVRRIFCVGRNYREHAHEMGGDPAREPPFFFSKPADAIVQNGATIPFPTVTKDLQHEIELVVVLGKGGTKISVDKALDHVFGYAVGIDMTRRDIQAEAKKMGRPWDMAKGFDDAAPVSAIQPASKIGHPATGTIRLSLNGTPRQKGDLADQIWNVPETISYLSGLVALKPGDLIFTGTPAGVGKVAPGDRLEGHIDGIGDLAITYRSA